MEVSTPANTMGAGDPILPSETNTGNIGTVVKNKREKHKKKKKMKTLTEYLLEKMNDWQIIDGIKCRIIKKHVTEIQPGDTVLIKDVLKTVGKNDIKHNGFNGTTLFGDSYKSGREMVDYVEIYKAGVKK